MHFFWNISVKLDESLLGNTSTTCWSTTETSFGETPVRGLLKKGKRQIFHIQLLFSDIIFKEIKFLFAAVTTIKQSNSYLWSHLQIAKYINCSSCFWEDRQGEII